MADDQPRISDALGAAWIQSRYDHGPMPEQACRIVEANRRPTRVAPRIPTAIEAAYRAARNRQS